MSNEPKQQVDRQEVMLRNVRTNAKAQKTFETRENYFRSCEAHGPELAAVVAIVRQEFYYE